MTTQTHAMHHHWGDPTRLPIPIFVIIITQRFDRQLIASLKVIANLSDVSNVREDNVVSGATDCDGEKYFICLCRAEKKAEAQMKFNSQGVLGEGVKERYGEPLAYLGCLLGIAGGLFDGKGNMSKPALAVHQGGMQEGIHRVSFNVVLFTEWEVLESKCKLGVEVLSNLELGIAGNAFHFLVMDHTILEDVKAVGNCQKLGDNSSSSRSRCATRRDAGQMAVL